MAIPMGTFVRGEIVAAKRPGFLKGRGEFRVAIRQMTFVNGYTIDLLASPGSVDPKTGAGVDAEGKIKGPSQRLARYHGGPLDHRWRRIHRPHRWRRDQ